MDGTIYLGNELFDFTKDFLNKVEETGREYYFFTNNSSKSQQAYIDKLGNMGIHIEPKTDDDLKSCYDQVSERKASRGNYLCCRNSIADQ